jgi:hypothetical protein
MQIALDAVRCSSPHQISALCLVVGDEHERCLRVSTYNCRHGIDDHVVAFADGQLPDIRNDRSGQGRRRWRRTAHKLRVEPERYNRSHPFAEAELRQNPGFVAGAGDEAINVLQRGVDCEVSPEIAQAPRFTRHPARQVEPGEDQALRVGRTLIWTLTIIHQPAVVVRSEPRPADRHTFPPQPAHCTPRQHIARMHQMHNIWTWHVAQHSNKIAVRRNSRAHPYDPNAIDRFGALDQTEMRRFRLPVGQGIDFMPGTHQRLTKRPLGPVAKMAADAAQSDDQNAHRFPYTVTFSCCRQPNMPLPPDLPQQTTRTVQPNPAQRQPLHDGAPDR